MQKPRNEFEGPIDWNDTSHPAVRQAEREEREDYENAGADRAEDLEEYEGDFADAPEDDEFGPHP